MTTPIEGTLTAKLVHFMLITLIVVYVVFVKKSSAVESVSTSAKIVYTPSTFMKGPFYDPNQS